MRVMVMVKATKSSEAGGMPDEKSLAEMGRFNAELVKAGVMLAGEGLHPSSKGARVIFSGGKRTVVDGPFAEAKELIAGFSIIEAESLAEVIELIKQWPKVDGHGNAQIEIRQIFTAEDLGFSEQQRERYAKLEAEAAQQQ